MLHAVAIAVVAGTHQRNLVLQIAPGLAVLVNFASPWDPSFNRFWHLYPE